MTNDVERQNEGDLLAGVKATNEVARDHDLIASDRVEGTAVYRRDGNRLGKVRRFLVEKRTGQVHYVELGFGGFLGIGEESHPLPWEMLTYDMAKGGYVIDLSDNQITGAPRYGAEELRTIDASYAAEIRGYYGLS